MIKNPKSTTRYKRREETEEALRYIHGGLDGAIFGAWDFLVGNISDDTLLDKLISSYKRGRYLQGIFGKAIKDYNKSEDAIKKAVAIKYQNFLSRRKYMFVCKTQNSVFDPDKELWVPRNFKCLGVNVRLPSSVSQDKVENFIKALDIGFVSPIPHCSGVSRTVTGLLFMIMDLHLRVSHLRKKLVWYNNNEFNFVFQFSDDGAPETSELTMSIGSLTSWNFGEMVRSREYHYLLHCLSVSEKEDVMSCIWKQHSDEMETLEGNIFHVAGEKCTVQFQPSADQSWQSWANNETTQAATFPSPFANVNKGNMNIVNGSIGFESTDTWKPFTMKQRVEDVEKLQAFCRKLKPDLSEQTKHKKKLDFMAENLIRQYGLPRIGKFADLQRPEPVHCEINSWGHFMAVIYKEAIRRNKLEDFLSILASPVSQSALEASTEKELAESERANIIVPEGTGERSRQIELVSTAGKDFSNALSKIKVNQSKLSKSAGCGLPFIARLVKEHHNEDHGHGRKLTVRLIGEQAIQLARYSYRLLESLKTKDESKEEEIKRLALCKIAQLLRDAATLFNKVHVTAAEVLQLKEICQTFQYLCLISARSIKCYCLDIGLCYPLPC